MSKIYIVRHGQTDWNIDGRLNSFTETQLNKHGENEARLFAMSFQSANLFVTKIFSSTSRRAIQTAAIISSIVNVPYEPIAALREVDLGIFEGKTYDEIDKSKELKEHYDKWLSGAVVPHIAEDLKSCVNRIEESYRLIKVQDCLVITHGIFTRMLLLHSILGSNVSRFKALQIDNLSVTKIETGDIPKVAYLNVHLK